MKKIESFTVNHLKLKKGLYLSRKDEKGGAIVTTFDLRFTAPNVEKPLKSDAIHTIEHIFATYLRNSEIKSEVIYFGPMGCKTGFYLVLFGDKTPNEVYKTVVDACNYLINFEGEIPGATAIECGNYKLQNLTTAKKYVKNYLLELTTFKRFEYEI